MKVTLNIQYDQEADKDLESAKLDRFFYGIYGKGVWNKKRKSPQGNPMNLEEEREIEILL